MVSITRNVRDLPASARTALEDVIGQRLGETQQIIFNVVNLDSAPPADEPHQNGSSALPSWCDVYEGMSEAEVDEIEKSIVRTSTSRSVE
jgi:hypothetical protein